MEKVPISPQLQAAIDDVLGDPALLDELSSALVSEIRERVPAYRGVPVESLTMGNRRVLVSGLSHIAAGRLPNAAELREISVISQVRARQGVDLASVLAAYQISGHRVWAILSERARSRGAAEAGLVPAVTLIWEWLDVVTVAAATAHRDVDLQIAREDEQRVGEALRAVLLEPCSAATGQRHLLALGLAPGGHYAAFRGRLTSDTTVAMLRASLPGHVVLGASHHDVIGLAGSGAPLTDVLTAELGRFGVGRLERAGQLHASYLDASRALSAALHLGLAGISTLEELRLAAAAATDPDMTRILRDRILRPLHDHGRYAEEIWRSVIVHLEHGMRIDAAATALHVHANTLRHRLTRFTEATGVDFRNTADIAELWWLAVADGGTDTTTEGER